ncbi:MAG: hypothetical protein IPL95_17090 [Saprospiraceae bacterium]|nr:hypothetical protein [Saprospiraceae bacterium]
MRSLLLLSFLFSFVVARASILSLMISDSTENTLYFKGRMDDLNDIAIVIKKDSVLSVATITILRSGVMTSFEGTFQKNKFLFKEKNNAAKSTFLGKLKEGELDGQWIFENQNSSRIIARKTNKIWTIPSNCADNKWLKTFRGALNYSEAILTIQKLAENKISGSLYLEKENRTYRISGDIDLEKMNLTIKDNIGNTIGRLDGSFNMHNNLKFKFWNEKQNESYAVFEQTRHFQYGCIEFVDKNISYDATYPKLQHEKFNIWLENNIQNWLIDTRKRLLEIKSGSNNTQSAQSWCEINTISDGFISGIITNYDSESNNYQTNSINYTFKKSKSILLKDIFLNEPKANSEIMEIIQKGLKSQIYQEDKELKEWVSKENFENFVFQKEGILFLTNFNPIYNRISYLVPYNTLEDKLNSFGKELFIGK